MKIRYDSETDSMYIRLVDGPQECRTVRLSEEIALNLGEGEVLVGIEILDAKAILGAGRTPIVEFDGIIPSGASLSVREEPEIPYGKSPNRRS